MINLVPPDIKNQRRFSQHNVAVVHYIFVVVAVALAMSAVLFGSSLMAKQRISTLETDIRKNDPLINVHKETEAKAQKLKTKLKTIDDTFKKESHFLSFLEELEAAIPPWAKLQSLNLSHKEVPLGSTAKIDDSEKSLNVSFSIDDKDRVAILQRNLAVMKRVEFVDIQSINKTEVEGSNNYVVMVLMKLSQRPGELLVEPEGTSQ